VALPAIVAVICFALYSSAISWRDSRGWEEVGLFVFGALLLAFESSCFRAIFSPPLGTAAVLAGWCWR